MSDCVEWGGYVAPDGYGRTTNSYNGTRYAHRVTYMQHNGVVLTRSQVVRHLCDNRRCVNPEHLEVGSQRDNIRDCIERKRRAEMLSEPWLTEEQVQYCVSQYIPRSFTRGCRALSRELGVPCEVVSLAIRQGKSPSRCGVPH